jgi:hypothetical protein
MKMTGKTIGILMILLGGIWFLQGINILPGSFMTGQTRWAVYGGFSMAGGIALLLICRRSKPPSP